MPIDISKIDEQIAKIQESTGKLVNQLNDLEFIRGKMLHGTDDEKRIIRLFSVMTIDNIKAVIEVFQKDMKEFQI